MPDKARYGKGKHRSAARRKYRRPLAAVQAPTATAPAAKVTSRTSTAAPGARPVVASHPYVGVELLRIGVLTGAILVILFVLASVLTRS